MRPVLLHFIWMHLSDLYISCASPGKGFDVLFRVKAPSVMC